MNERSGPRRLVRATMGPMSAPRLVWAAVRDLVLAANAEDRIGYELALRRIVESDPAFDIDAQIMAIYVVGWCVRSRIGVTASTEAIESYSKLIGAKLRNLGRSGPSQTATLLKTVYRTTRRPMAPEEILVIGAAVAGIALGTSAQALDAIEHAACNWFADEWRSNFHVDDPG